MEKDKLIITCKYFLHCTLSMKPKKVKEKVMLQTTYKSNKNSENQFVEATVPVFAHNIGSHVMEDQTAKSYQKVIKRINSTNKNGPFSLPIMFNDKK